MARNKYPEETVQKILAVSYRLFLEKGYDHTTIQDITDALGMSKGAVYHHFKSKEAILDRIYDQYYAESGLHAAALDAPGLSGLEKLRKLLLLELTDQGKLSIDSVTLSFRSNPQLLQLMLTSSIRDASPMRAWPTVPSIPTAPGSWPRSPFFCSTCGSAFFPAAGTSFWPNFSSSRSSPTVWARPSSTRS